MVWHFALSTNPIMCSGVHILMKGKSDMSAICTASAVFPHPTGPTTNKQRIINRRLTGTYVYLPRFEKEVVQLSRQPINKRFFFSSANSRMCTANDI